MKLFKTSRLICLIAAAALLSGCAKADKNNDNNSQKEDENMNTVTAEAENVKLIGRTHMIDDTLWLALSGTGIEFEYTGTKLDVTLVGDEAASLSKDPNSYSRVGVYVDGERVADQMLELPQTELTVFESQQPKTVTVKILKLSECAMSTFGIKPLSVGEGGSVKPTADKDLKIEFIGDSITCGYGVDDEDPEHKFSTQTEDVTKAYAYKTAQKLDADYSMFSTSGYGIITGYTDNGQKHEEQAIPQYYESLGFSYNNFAKTDAPQSIDWDFSKFVPDAVVINLGTNDDSYCQNDIEKQDEYSAAYVEFLKTVRKDNPDAVIVCTVGIMGGRIYPALATAVENYKSETGDDNVYSFKFDQQLQEDGYAADWHPTEATHEKASDRLVEELQNLLK